MNWRKSFIVDDFAALWRGEIPSVKRIFHVSTACFDFNQMVTDIEGEGPSLRVTM